MPSDPTPLEQARAEALREIRIEADCECHQCEETRDRVLDALIAAAKAEERERCEAVLVAHAEPMLLDAFRAATRAILARGV